MGFFKDFRKFITEIAGEVVSSNINMIGELMGNKYVKEVGQGVKVASKEAAETFSQANEGAVGVVDSLDLWNNKKVR